MNAFDVKEHARSVQWLLAEIDGLLDPELPARDLAEILLCLTDAGRSVAMVKRTVEDCLGAAMQQRDETFNGVGTFRRATRKKRTGWDKEELLRVTLDSRLVDEQTGDVLDESPLEKAMHVLPWGEPRVTAMRERGLEPDEFCTVTPEPGFSIRVLSDNTEKDS